MQIKSIPNPITITLWSLVLISLVASVIALSYSLTNRSKDIVCVDALKLITKFKGIQEGRKALQSRNEALKSRLDTLKNEFDALLKEYQSKKVTSPAKEVKQLEQLLQGKQRTLVNYENTLQQQIKKQDEELASKILARVNNYVKRYGKEKGYTIILAATQMGSVAYTNESYDVTDEVLAGLNAEYEKSKK